MKSKALIFGICGQDGSLLADYLLQEGYRVFGTTRNKNTNLNNLEKLGIAKDVNLFKGDFKDLDDVTELLKKIEPREIYYLSGQSSVSSSFVQPYETFTSHNITLINILEFIRLHNTEIKVFNAASSEMFGDISCPANENSPFSPKSPYGVAKVASFNLTKIYRNSFKLFACNGIIFNHESHLRPDNFVTKKIISSAKNIKDGLINELYLGNLDIKRDWGWAPEYVKVMHKILQQDISEDYVIATGQSNSLRNFLDQVFKMYDLDYRDYVKYDPELSRTSDLISSYADPSKARLKLGWEAKYKMKEIIERMIQNG